MVFASSDRLHARTAQLFMEAGQSFVNGQELKEDLRKLNEHYSKLPDEIKIRGVFEYTTYPPEDQDTLIGKLFDKHLKSSWRANAKKDKEQIGKPKKHDEDFMKELKQRQNEAQPYTGTPPPSDAVDSMTLTRKVPAKRGSWVLFPPEVINKKKQ